MTTYGWGDTLVAHALGIGSTAAPLVPTLVGLPVGVSVQRIASSGQATFFLLSDGRVYGCGENSLAGGLLGIGTIDASGVEYDPPVQVTGAPLAVDLSSAHDATFILTSTGDLYGWGVNSHGTLGLGNTTAQPSPVFIRSGVAHARAGDNVAIISLTGTGQVLTAGQNTLGRTGQGVSTGDTTSFTAIASGDVAVDVATLGTASLIILSGGSVKAAGLSTSGALGFPCTTAQNVHTTIPGLSNIVQVMGNGGDTSSPPTTNFAQGFYLDSSGIIHVYGGSTSSGAFGTGATSFFFVGRSSSDTPLTVAMPVTCRSLLCCDNGFNLPGAQQFWAAIGTDNLLYTWGRSTNGQMGSGADAVVNAVPVSVNGLSAVGNGAIGWGGIWAVTGAAVPPTGRRRAWAAVIG